MDPAYDLWYASSLLIAILTSNEWNSYDPDADKNCERLLEAALKTDPGNSEALQSLANVRMSQQRPDDAKQCLEQSWTAWKDLDIGMSMHLFNRLLELISTQTTPLSRPSQHGYP